MKSILVLLLRLAFVSVQADNNPREREQKIAKRDVWHAAKLRGVSFRAIGQEPGWLLEISNGEKIYLYWSQYASQNYALSAHSY